MEDLPTMAEYRDEDGNIHHVNLNEKSQVKHCSKGLYLPSILFVLVQYLCFKPR